MFTLLNAPLGPALSTYNQAFSNSKFHNLSWERLSHLLASRHAIQELVVIGLMSLQYGFPLLLYARRWDKVAEPSILLPRRSVWSSFNIAKKMVR